MLAADPTTFVSVRDGSSFSDAMRVQFVNLGIVLLFALPALLGTGSSILRPLFPFLALAASVLMLMAGRFPAFATLVLWFFTLTPFVRRLVDYDSGWSQANTLMLAPYAAALPVLAAIPMVLVRRDIPMRRVFAVLFAAILFGLVVAIFRGQMFAGVYATLRWIVPPCFAVYILANRNHLKPLLDNLAAYFVLSAILVSLYGIHQFVAIQPWDGFWMIQSKMESIGTPHPFDVRVFSTWNSPGSLAYYLLACILVLLASKGMARLIALPPALVALALTQGRSAWAALAIGLGILTVLGSSRIRMSALAVPAAVLFLLPIGLSLPDVGPLLEKRIETFRDISSDTSFRVRSDGYSMLVDELSERILGEGIAVGGAYQGYADGGRLRIIDGGPIEVLLALGLLGGIAYLLSIVVLSAAAALRPAVLPIHTALKAVTAVFLLMMIAGTSTVGESGMFFWIAVGCLLATPDVRRSNAVVSASPIGNVL
jgi:hypothetical protein